MSNNNHDDDQSRSSADIALPSPPVRGVRQLAPLHVLPVVGRNGVTRHCWEIVQSPENNLHGTCEECYAYFVQRDCWTLWALREAGHKPCCQKESDCTKCPVLLQQVAPKRDETVQVRPRMPVKPVAQPTGRSKQVCRYLDVIDVPVSPESAQYLSAVSRAVQSRNSTFRCRLRGVHLDVGYVGDMCVSRHVQDCVFMEEAQPQMDVQGPTQMDEAEKLPLADEDSFVPTEASRNAVR